MKKELLFALVFFAFIALLFFFQFPPSQTAEVFAPNGRISAKVANTPALWARGLMHETSLCHSCGMLFVFNDNATRHFWMKDTPIPLDIIFIYENMSVQSVHYATPCEKEPCHLYSSGAPVKYALELNANASRFFGIFPSSQLRIATNLSSG